MEIKALKNLQIKIEKKRVIHLNEWMFIVEKEPLLKAQIDLC